MQGSPSCSQCHSRKGPRDAYCHSTGHYKVLRQREAPPSSACQIGMRPRDSAAWPLAQERDCPSLSSGDIPPPPRHDSLLSQFLEITWGLFVETRDIVPLIYPATATGRRTVVSLQLGPSRSVTWSAQVGSCIQAILWSVAYGGKKDLLSYL